MQALSNDLIAHRLESVKGLYAELFLLMDQSLQEDPLTEATGALDCAIDQLMITIELTTQEFRREVESARGGRQLDETLDGALMEFDERLREGLQLMLERIRRRTEELARDRDQLKDRLQSLRQSWRGAQGYRPHIGSEKIINSRA